MRTVLKRSPKLSVDVLNRWRKRVRVPNLPATSSAALGFKRSHIRLKLAVSLVLKGHVCLCLNLSYIWWAVRGRRLGARETELDVGRGRLAISKIYAMLKKVLTVLAWTRRHIFAPKHREDWSNSRCSVPKFQFSHEIFSFCKLRNGQPRVRISNTNQQPIIITQGLKYFVRFWTKKTYESCFHV